MNSRDRKIEELYGEMADIEEELQILLKRIDELESMTDEEWNSLHRAEVLIQITKGKN